MIRHRAARFWMLSGPACLLLGFLLLLIRSAPLMGRPMWLCGLSATMAIASFVTYLAYREVVDSQERFRLAQKERADELHSLRETLSETGALYREKVDLLEASIKEVEAHKEDLESAYKKAHQQAHHEHSRASAFHTSLNDALDELRQLRQLEFLRDEAGATLPPDLPGRYRQLKEQFDEKALILNQTRRRLFSVEGQLFALAKTQTEEKLSNPEDIQRLYQEICMLDEENQRLERDVSKLEGVISELLKGKMSKSDAPKKRVEQMLEFQFDTLQ